MAITKLFVKHVSTGVYGRVLLSLTRGTKRGGANDGAEEAKGDRANKQNDEVQSKLRVFGPGDIVGLFQSDRHHHGGENGNRVDGLVYKVNYEEIVIAFNEMHDFVSLPLRLINAIVWLGIDETALIAGQACKRSDLLAM